MSEHTEGSEIAMAELPAQPEDHAPQPEDHTPQPEEQAAQPDGEAAQPQEPPVQSQGQHAAPAPASPVALEPMKLRIFGLAVTYLVLLMALFIVYATSSSFRSDIPEHFGQLPVGVAWFGATGAVIASLYGIFVHNQAWDKSYNYWHYCRPLFGAITGSIGALIYLVLLNLGSTTAIKVDNPTFYVVAFVLGFADKAFMQMLQNVTNVIIKPGSKAAPTNSNGSKNGVDNAAEAG
jgi:hypothetical protein